MRADRAGWRSVSRCSWEPGSGEAALVIEGNRATVTLKTDGLLDDAHPMHIHAGERGTRPTAAAARPHHGNRSISTLDGAAFYGSPRVSLTTRGDIGVVSILVNPRLLGEATAQALCGELAAGGGERARVYRASLTLPAAGPGSICHLRPAT